MNPMRVLLQINTQLLKKFGNEKLKTSNLKIAISLLLIKQHWQSKNFINESIVAKKINCSAANG